MTPGKCVTVQSDGKIVVAGRSWSGSSYDIAVVRYTNTGALDASFNSGGKVTTDFGSTTDQAYSVAVQSDGKILVGGYSDSGGSDRFALVRYTSTGALDSSFGTGGKVTTLIGSYCTAYSMAVQGDGQIVLAGDCLNGSTYDFALARYTTSGTLDASFGTGGTVITDIGGGDDSGIAVAVQSNGKSVVAGYASIGGTNVFALLR